MEHRKGHALSAHALPLIAHIQNVGDTPSGPDGWAGEPGSKLAVEGFIIPAVPHPELAGLTYQTIAPGGAFSAPAQVGGYCGTTGLSQPTLGLRLQLPPGLAGSFQVTCEASFMDGSKAGPVEAGTSCQSASASSMEAFRIMVRDNRLPASAPRGLWAALKRSLLAKPAAPAASAPPEAETEAKIKDPHPSLEQLVPRHSNEHYLTPTDLSVSDLRVRRVAVIGSCFVESWRFPEREGNECAFDVFIADSPPDPPPNGLQISDYDFQIIQIPLRSVLHDGVDSKIPYSDIEGYRQVLEAAYRNLEFQLSSKMLWNRKYNLLTFVTNFLVPQRNMIGILFPRYDIRNPEYMVHLLNERLEALVRAHPNAYMLDADRISASFGRRYVQDDAIDQVNHNSILPTPDIDTSRIEPLPAMSDHYEIRWFPFLRDAIWAEAVAMYRIVRQCDAVKLVIMDLDDTLWAGVAGDADDIAGLIEHSWVLGLTEALSVLKKRGILLAIASKNDESRIREIWPKLFGNLLSLDDFAAVRINWRPKTENIQEILSLLNLLPSGTVFVDDNPAERAAVQLVFPEMRILGRYPYYLRRILLWSSETQVADISEESSRRTEMVQAQVFRETRREAMTRAEFLAEASPRVGITWLEGTHDPRFARAFELINKTNQFNTTGRRWTSEAIGAFFVSGGQIVVFNVQDAFTNYGLVGAILMHGAAIEQWVMSCRVFGYDIEQAVMSVVVQALRDRGASAVSGILLERAANFPCRELFRKCRFRQEQERWILEGGETIAIPGHITIVGAA